MRPQNFHGQSRGVFSISSGGREGGGVVRCENVINTDNWLAKWKRLLKQSVLWSLPDTDMLYDIY